LTIYVNTIRFVQVTKTLIPGDVRPWTVIRSQIREMSNLKEDLSSGSKRQVVPRVPFQRINVDPLCIDSVAVKVGVSSVTPARERINRPCSDS